MNVKTIVLLLSLALNREAVTSRTYRAGVVQLKLVPYSGTDKETMIESTKLVDEYAREANKLGVDLLVFPEYGITTFKVGNETRKEFDEAVQDVPDPRVVEWNPCLEPERFQHNEVIHELSCSARNNDVVIVANLLTRETCDQYPNATCPSDGYFIFNTNVVFAKNGTFLYRYHKRHLYFEDLLNPAPEAEYYIVDAGFVKFATFICFDIFYSDPAVRLVTDKGIRNLVFTTALVNELPFYTSPQQFSQFAHALGANLIVSNMYYPEDARLGSGIYSSSSGVLNQTWDLSTPGRLVIADVPVDPPSLPEETTITCPPKSINSGGNVDRDFRNSTTIQEVLTDKPSSQPMENKTHQIYYEPLEAYARVYLNGKEGSAEVCQGQLCCKLNFTFSNRDEGDVYVFTARSGRRTFGKNPFGMQACSIFRCENNTNIESCGRVPERETKSLFSYLSVEAVFSTSAIFPDVFDVHLNLVPTTNWKFTKNTCDDEDTTSESSATNLGKRTYAKLETTLPIESPLLVYTLLARVYDWDREF